MVCYETSWCISFYELFFDLIEYGTVGAEVQEREAIDIGRTNAPGGDTESLRLPETKVLTTPAVRRIAMENKVQVKIKPYPLVNTYIFILSD